MRFVSVSDLKARLSEYLRYATAGERVVVTHRGRAVAELGPAAGQNSMDAALAELAASGLLRRGASRIPARFWKLPRPGDPKGSVRSALLQERDDRR